MLEEYLEDATPCTECGTEPYERIDRCPPLIICGIGLNSGYGTMLRCGKCGKQTVAYSNPQDAYRAWNEDVNREAKECEG